MDGIIKFITENISSFTPKSIFKLIIFFILIIIIIPIIEAQYLNYSHLKTKSEILKNLGAITTDRLQEDLNLELAYNETLKEFDTLESAKINIININNVSFLSFGNTSIWWKKMISGSFLSLLLIPLMILDKKLSKKQKLSNSLVLLFLGVLLGFLALLIPVLFNKPMITYIGVPMLQILIIAIAAILTSKSKKKNLPLQSEGQNP